jgi:hypothetical protein
MHEDFRFDEWKASEAARNRTALSSKEGYKSTIVEEIRREKNKKSHGAPQVVHSYRYARDTNPPA